MALDLRAYGPHWPRRCREQPHHAQNAETVTLSVGPGTDAGAEMLTALKAVGKWLPRCKHLILEESFVLLQVHPSDVPQMVGSAEIASAVQTLTLRPAMDKCSEARSKSTAEREMCKRLVPLLSSIERCCSQLRQVRLEVDTEFNRIFFMRTERGELTHFGRGVMANEDLQSAMASKEKVDTIPTESIAARLERGGLEPGDLSAIARGLLEKTPSSRVHQAIERERQKQIAAGQQRQSRPVSVERPLAQHVSVEVCHSEDQPQLGVVCPAYASRGRSPTLRIPPAESTRFAPTFEASPEPLSRISRHQRSHSAGAGFLPNERPVEPVSLPMRGHQRCQSGTAWQTPEHHFHGAAREDPHEAVSQMATPAFGGAPAARHQRSHSELVSTSAYIEQGASVTTKDVLCHGYVTGANVATKEKYAQKATSSVMNLPTPSRGPPRGAHRVPRCSLMQDLSPGPPSRSVSKPVAGLTAPAGITVRPLGWQPGAMRSHLR